MKTLTLILILTLTSAVGCGQILPDDSCSGHVESTYTMNSDLSTDFTESAVTSEGVVTSSDCSLFPEGMQKTVSVDKIERQGNTIAFTDGGDYAEGTIDEYNMFDTVVISDYVACKVTLYTTSRIDAEHGLIINDTEFVAEGVACGAGQ